jgi:hypothetical protein
MGYAPHQRGCGENALAVNRKSQTTRSRNPCPGCSALAAQVQQLLHQVDALLKLHVEAAMLRPPPLLVTRCREGTRPDHECACKTSEHS